MAKAKKTKKSAKAMKPKKAAKPKVAQKVKAKKTSPKKQVIKSKTTMKSQPKSTAPQNKPAVKPASSKKLNPGKVKWSEFVTPLDDRVIVQISNTERKTAGGLYIPDTSDYKAENTQGVVVSVGRGHRNEQGKIRPMDVQIGDRLIFSQYAGSKLELLGETLILLRESEVMGIVTK